MGLVQKFAWREILQYFANRDWFNNNHVYLDAYNPARNGESKAFSIIKEIIVFKGIW